MLTRLKVSNFRIFDDEVTVDFRPITVLIGKNNAGKSSIIKFLLMLRQSCGARGGPFFAARGDFVNLGNFYNLKNTRSKKRGLKFSLCMQGGISPGDPIGSYLRDKGINPEETEYQVAANVLYNKQGVFQGKEMELGLFADSEKVLESFETISDNGKFLDFTGGCRAVQHCAELIGQNIQSLDHIAPSKADISRVIDIGEKVPTDSVGQDGKYGSYYLHHLWDYRNERGTYGNKYKFAARYLERILDVQKINFLGHGDLAQCEVIHSKTGARVNLASLGFGVSQCLPIFVQGAMMYPGTMLMVEQPEAQVHPTAQLELGGFVADLWKERGVGSIIETHSSNILLRLRRLIAKNELAAKDVSVAFFDIEDKKPVVTNLEINKDGSFQDGLPMEFFHEEIWEAMDMGAGK